MTAAAAMVPCKMVADSVVEGVQGRHGHSGKHQGDTRVREEDKAQILFDRWLCF